MSTWKTFTVAIAEDGTTETEETFKLLLTNSNGGATLRMARASLMITDRLIGDVNADRAVSTTDLFRGAGSSDVAGLRHRGGQIAFVTRRHYNDLTHAS